MITNDWDKYDEFADSYNPLQHDRQARRSRKPKAKHIAKKNNQQIIHEVVDDTIGLEGGFKTTYQPGLFEEGWLLAALQAFYDQSFITDVLGRVKGGKEANVYRCAGHPALGVDLLAAKVYRPRMFRNLRNDKMYREGRVTLTDEGRAVKATDQRIMRAMGKKSAFGQQVSHTSWIMYEYTTLERLYKAGVSVPRPYMTSENAILMEYIGDESLAAPILQSVSLEKDEAEALFAEVIRNIKLMLSLGMVHGDLSAYNILYWEGEITLIDFPQVTDMLSNRNARQIFERDIERVTEYFNRQGVVEDGRRLARSLWEHYYQDDPAIDLSEFLDD